MSYDRIMRVGLSSNEFSSICSITFNKELALGQDFGRDTRMTPKKKAQQWVLQYLQCSTTSKELAYNCLLRPGLWKRYLDDACCSIMKKWRRGGGGGGEELLDHLNSIKSSIKLTMELEVNGSLPFLSELPSTQKWRWQTDYKINGLPKTHSPS